MKKILLIILIVLLGITLWAGFSYNKLVDGQEAVDSAWSQVENVYQRRADLVPNLVAVVKEYTDYEQGTLTAVTEARAKAMQTTVSRENFDEAAFNKANQAQDELNQAINRLIVSVENYPDLKANENYLTLQAELAGCENRIQTERERFDEAARAYNSSLRHFPTNLIAKMFHFEKRPYFKADSGAEQVPTTF
jgi:LemA protein